MSSEFLAPDVLTGHLGHLNEAQERALAIFKDVLANARLYTPPSQVDGHTTPASHDEPTLLCVPVPPAALRCCPSDPVSTQALPPRTPLRPAKGPQAVLRRRGLARAAQRRRPLRDLRPRRVRGRAQVLPPLDRPPRQGASAPVRRPPAPPRTDPPAVQNGLPVYVYRLTSLTGPAKQALDAVPPERRYQRM